MVAIQTPSHSDLPVSLPRAGHGCEIGAASVHRPPRTAWRRSHTLVGAPTDGGLHPAARLRLYNENSRSEPSRRVETASAREKLTCCHVSRSITGLRRTTR